MLYFEFKYEQDAEPDECDERCVHRDLHVSNINGFGQHNILSDNSGKSDGRFDSSPCAELQLLIIPTVPVDCKSKFIECDNTLVLHEDFKLFELNSSLDVCDDKYIWTAADDGVAGNTFVQREQLAQVY